MDDRNRSGMLGTGTETKSVPVHSFCAVGNDSEKLKMLILHHVETSTFRKVFSPLSSSDHLMEELTCSEACNILKSLEDPKTAEDCCFAMTTLLSSQKSHLIAIDKTITDIIKLAYRQQILSLFAACKILITSMDLRMTVPLSQEKMRFIKEGITKLDYKNMRDLIKLFLVEKLSKIEWSYTEYQHRELKPIEDLVIDLIDRKKNYCPALFFITEISRIDTRHSSIHFLPRVSLKIRELIASFRPLAEIGTMIGRSWMYPIVNIPTFSWHSDNWSNWKLNDASFKLQFKTHLPYSNEINLQQYYYLYIVLKQPRGQINLQNLHQAKHSQNKPQFDDIIEILILEAMSAMEESEQAVLSVQNQYNWLHLTHLVIYALCSSYCTFQNLFGKLLKHFSESRYQRSKEEIMWIILQYISIAKQISRLKFDVKDCDLVLEIFNSLYPENSMPTCSTEDPLNMVRFFTPAAIWINLTTHTINQGQINLPLELPIPPKLTQLVEFLENKSKEGNNQMENHVISCIGNAYSNNPKVFEEYVSIPILKMLGAQLSSSSGSEHLHALWTLPFGRKTTQYLNPIELGFLDSLSFHAKSNLLHSFTTALQHLTSTGFLPSPALVESMVRLFLTIDSILTIIDRNSPGTHLANLLHSEPKNIDLIAIWLDVFNYRFRNLTFSASVEIMNLNCVVEAFLLTIGQRKGTQYIELSWMLEQFVIRHIILTSPSAFLFKSINIIKQQNVLVLLFYYGSKVYERITPESSNTLNQHKQYDSIVGEINKIFLLNLIRTLKLVTGTTCYYATESTDIANSLMHPELKWPESAVQWFPNPLKELVYAKDAIDRGPDPQYLDELERLSEEEMSLLLNTPFPTEIYQGHTLLITIFRCLRDDTSINEYYSTGGAAFSSYKLLTTLSSHDLIRNVNSLVDYVIWKFQSHNDEAHLVSLVNVLNDMLFAHNFVPIERFLFSLIVRPNDDNSIRASLMLLAKLLSFGELEKRIRNICNFSPLQQNSLGTKSEEFFKGLSEHYNDQYREFSYKEMLEDQSPNPTNHLSDHLPVYYGNLAERIIPTVDILFQRSLETNIDQSCFETFLNAFGHLYKLHPQPLTFLYRTIYPLIELKNDELNPPVHILKKLVYHVVVHSCHTMTDDNKLTAFTFCNHLISNIVKASTYVHQLPCVHVDWRISEFPPAAHAVTCSLINILVSKFGPTEIVGALLDLAISHILERPYDTINAIAIVLTGLPIVYQMEFFTRVEESFKWLEDDCDCAQLFESPHHELYLHSNSQILTMLAMIHGFIQHGGTYTLSLLEKAMKQFGEKVNNEAQLIMFMRILMPYLQRTIISASQFEIIVYTYKVIGNLMNKIGQLEYEDTIVDLLYQFKYNFVGYYLKTEIGEVINGFPGSMKEKLKFLLTHSEATNAPSVVHQHAATSRQLSMSQSHLQIFTARPSGALFDIGTSDTLDSLEAQTIIPDQILNINAEQQLQLHQTQEINPSTSAFQPQFSTCASTPTSADNSHPAAQYGPHFPQSVPSFPAHHASMAATLPPNYFIQNPALNFMGIHHNPFIQR